MHAAICACKMYIQRGRDPINKLVVGAGMPFDSRFQTVAKVQDNRIIGRYARPYRKLDDSIGAMMVSQPIGKPPTRSAENQPKGETTSKKNSMGSVIEVLPLFERQICVRMKNLTAGDRRPRPNLRCSRVDSRA